MEWNSVRLGGHTHGLVTKTVHKTVPGGSGGQGVGVGEAQWVGVVGWLGFRGLGVGVIGVGWWGSRWGWWG